MKLCRIYRLIISSRLSDGAALPRFVTQHCEHCAACRQTVANWQAMENSLRQTVSAERSEPSPWLATRIMQNLDAPEKQTVSAGMFSRVAILGSLTVIAAVLVIQSRQSEPVAVAVNPPQPPTTIITTTPSLATVVDTTRIKELASNWDQPLQVELKSVMADAKLALNGLAHNFLPDGYQ